ncbi:hypothetical protein [Symbiobacterium terraclitae]|uniref:hypothetical protein n=1 Tax=Symbiobacterium terraclitae TaxID=557451 RepID=UPI0035B52BD8
MSQAAVVMPRIRLPQCRLVVIDCYAAPEALADWANAPKPGTSFELLDLDRTSSGDPAGGHVVVLRDELPAWEAAARAHGVRLVTTEASVRIGEWPGDAVVRSCGPGNLIIEIPC